VFQTRKSLRGKPESRKNSYKKQKVSPKKENPFLGGGGGKDRKSLPHLLEKGWAQGKDSLFH